MVISRTTNRALAPMGGAGNLGGLDGRRPSGDRRSGSPPGGGRPTGAVVRAVDLDVPLVLASGQDIVHDVVTVVGVDRRRGGFQCRSVEREEGADCRVDVFLRGVVVVAIDNESASYTPNSGPVASPRGLIDP